MTISGSEQLWTSTAIIADCQQDGVHGSGTAYLIAVGGTKTNPVDSHIQDYYGALFTTRGNVTSWFVTSSNNEVSEQVVGCYLDRDHGQVYLMADVNAQAYEGATVYDRGADPGIDNPNILVMAYSFRLA